MDVDVWERLVLIENRQAAQEMAIALLYAELAAHDLPRAQALVGKLRACAALPMGAGSARAVELLSELLADWLSGPPEPCAARGTRP